MMYKIPWLFISIATAFSLYAPIDPKQIPDLLKNKDQFIHVAIIGGGPTGYAAGIPPARAGYRTVIFQGPKPGGELMDSAIVENWPGLPKDSGAASMAKLEKQVVQFGALLDPTTIVDVDFSSWPYKLSTNNGTSVYALTVIVATGATQKKLGIENEDLYWGRGLYSCGSCDASSTKDKNTVIIGGGDIAIQRAIQVASPAKAITLIVPDAELKATESMQKKLRCINKVTVLFNKKVTKILGDAATISHVELQDTLTGELSQFPAQSIFLSTSLTPNTDLFKNKLEFDHYGCIKLKDTRSQETPTFAVFAAGTVADPRYRQIATIIGDATKAAIDALRVLSQLGFDGVNKELIHDRLYKPAPLLPIKHIRSMPEFLNTIAHEVDPVLVEFYSPLCSHCKNMESRLSAASEKFKNELKVYKVNKDRLFKLLAMHKIEMIPAFILFKQGKEVTRLEGEISQEELFDFIRNGLNKPDLDEMIKG